MSERCCGNCRYAMHLEHQGQTLLVCPFRPERPGRFSAVEPQEECRNWAERVQPEREPDEGTRLIPLANIDGLCALVDAVDYEWLSRYTWFAACGSSCVYACTHCNGKRCYMHRMIMNPPEGMLVDHKNRYGLDNHRINLRNATHQQNSVNLGRKPGVSGFRGVIPRGDKWLARIWHRGENLPLGLFDDPAEAARAWDRKAIELRGEFAYLNFPQEAGRRIVSLSGTIRLRSGAAACLRAGNLRFEISDLRSPRCGVRGAIDPRRRGRCEETPFCREERKKAKEREGVCCASLTFFGLCCLFRPRIPALDFLFTALELRPKRSPATRACRGAAAGQGMQRVSLMRDACRTTHNPAKTPRPAPCGHGPRMGAAWRRPPLWARGPPGGSRKSRQPAADPQIGLRPGHSLRTAWPRGSSDP